MAKKTVVETEDKEASVGVTDLAQALVQAINLTKPVEKKTFATRKPKTLWTVTDGTKPKLKRAAHQHGIELDPDKLSAEEIALFNKLRPGRFLDGHVVVTRRRDKGIDISYPVKTSAQRLRLVNLFGIRNLAELLGRCIHEAENPKPQIEDLD